MAAILGQCAKGLIFIVSAPAGTGKTTLVQMLAQEFPSIVASVSYTTRAPRLGEQEGKHYHFISQQAFKEKIDESDFLEYVQLYQDYYGTSQQWINKQIHQGKHVVLVIDTQGALQLKNKIAATFIFIRPPSLEILKARLINRQTESIAIIDTRLTWAQYELEQADLYDYQIVNDDLAVAYQALRSVVIAETYRTRKN